MKIMIIDGENVRKVIYMKGKNDTISKMNSIALTFSIQAVDAGQKIGLPWLDLDFITCICTANIPAQCWADRSCDNLSPGKLSWKDQKFSTFDKRLTESHSKPKPSFYNIRQRSSQNLFLGSWVMPGNQGRGPGKEVEYQGWRLC